MAEEVDLLHFHMLEDDALTYDIGDRGDVALENDPGHLTHLLAHMTSLFQVERGLTHAGVMVARAWYRFRAKSRSRPFA